jgi:N-acetylmuramoyl-L-alanine amidase
MIDAPSPNWNERLRPVSIVVLHYTGMPSAEGALAWLRNPESRVSCHYFIAEDGTTFRLVDEARRAWHAGAGGWREVDSDVNSASIGIELVNPGHQHGYRPFPDEQIAALTPLLRGIVARHGVDPANVIGHSDLAPTRKEDPGELFPWDRLAAEGLATPKPPAGPDPNWTDAGADLALARYGYGVADAKAARIAFQRRFRPSRLDGAWDAEGRSILLGLLRAQRR